MSSTFGDYEIRKIRKEHICVSCNRKIPIGKKANYYNGMWEGDWQNWYMCMFCYEMELCEPGEGISGDEFHYWVSEEECCPKCLCTGVDWEWTDDNESIDLYCSDCSYKWVKEIGWEGKNER